VPACVRMAFAYLYQGFGAVAPDPRELRELVLAGPAERLAACVDENSNDYPSFGYSSLAGDVHALRRAPVRPLRRTESLRLYLDPRALPYVRPKKGHARTSGLVKEVVELDNLATPRANSHSCGVVLTVRSLNDLGTQLRFASKFTPLPLRESGEMNVNFTEFLMGFPTDWTKPPISEDPEAEAEALARHRARFHALMASDDEEEE